MVSNREKYKILIARHLGVEPEQVFLYWKGRVALYAILKSLSINAGDEIVLPGFTCVVVPNVIKYLNSKPVYVDIDSDTLNPGFNTVKKAVTSKTRVIIIQNTFGLSSDVDKISEFAKENGIITIEDCTHGFGGSFKNMPNGSYCDAAFYSTQWNKPFSTGIGGFAVINNKKLIPAIKKRDDELIRPSFIDEISLFFLNMGHKAFLHPWSYWLLRDFYRFLSTHGIVTGSSQKSELTSITIPGKYFKGISSVQAWLGLNRINEIDKIISSRIEYGKAYSKFLKEHGKIYVKEDLFIDHSFLKYPLIITDREFFKTRASKRHIPLGDWFLSPIHPVMDNFGLWDIDKELIPVAVEISQHIVNLPTEGIDIGRVIDFMADEIDMIR